MALAVTLKASGVVDESTSGTPASEALGAITFAAGSLVVVELGCTLAPAGATHTDLQAAASGLTFTEATGADSVTGDQSAIAILTAPHSAGGSTTITISSNGFSTYGLFYAIYEVTGQHTSPIGGKVATVQTAVLDGAYSITLDATPATTSYVLAAFCADTANTTNSVDPGAGWSEDADVDSSAAGFGVFEAQQRTGSTSTTVAWADIRAGASGALFVTAAAAVEIVAAAAAGSESPISSQYWPALTGGPWPRLQSPILPPADMLPQDLESPLLGAYTDGGAYWQVYGNNPRLRAFDEMRQRRRDQGPTEELVPPPSLVPLAVVTHWRQPWQRILEVQSDQSAAAVVDTDPTQGGYGPEWRRWRREPAQPPQRIPYESIPGLLETALLENELLGGATTELRTFVPATHADRREVPQYTLRQSIYGLLDQALLEVPPPLPDRSAVTHQRLPWLRIEQAQSDQSSAAVVVFDPTLAGYSLRPLWRRDFYPPTQREAISNPDEMEIVGTGATMAWWGVDDSAHHFSQWLPAFSVPDETPATPADPLFLVDSSRRERHWLPRPWGGVQIRWLADQSVPVVVTDADPTQLGGYGPEWRRWYRPPVAPQQRERESDPNLLGTALLEDALLGVGYGPRWMWYRAPVAPVQRERESDPRLLLTALLEDALLGGWDDLQRHRQWHASRRLYPQQRQALQEPPVPADAILLWGADRRVRYVPVSHAARWALRMQIRYLLFMGTEIAAGIQGNTYPPPHLTSGSAYPHSDGSIIGWVG